MTTEPDDDLDLVLRTAGSDWRSGQPAPIAPDPQALMAHRDSRRPSWLVPLAAVAGVLAVVAAVAVPFAMRPEHRSGDRQATTPTPNVSPSDVSEWLLPADPGDGVAVRAVGTLYRNGSGPILLCSAVAVTADNPTSSAGCEPVAVPVTGIDTNLLSHTTTTGQAYSDQLQLTGRYHGGKVAVDGAEAVRPTPPTNLPEPAVPCPAPDGGWPLGEGMPAGDDGMALNHMIENVRGHPERYADIWEGHPDGVGSAENSYMPSRMVYLVGTTGDVASARSELAAIFPGNLCVHSVRYSQTDLQTLAEKLLSINSTPVAAQALVIENLVQVRVIALDPMTMAALGIVDRAAMQIEPPLLLPA